MAVLAVLREGFETAVFLLAAFNASGSPVAAGFGALLGIVTATVIGYGIYRGGVRINLGRFFRVTGIVLCVAAGLVASAIHSAHEAGSVNFGQAQVADLTWLVQPGSIVSALLTGVLGRAGAADRHGGRRLAALPRTHAARRPVAGSGKAGAAAGASRQISCGYPRELKPGLVSRLPVRLVVPALPWALSAVLIGCSAGSTASPSGSIDPVGTAQVHVVLTNAGCVPDRSSVPAGGVTFSIVNEGGDAVSEVELMQGDRILGEREDLAPGLSGSFTLALEPGDYALACPGIPRSHPSRSRRTRAPFSASWRRRTRSTSTSGTRAAPCSPARRAWQGRVGEQACWPGTRRLVDSRPPVPELPDLAILADALDVALTGRPLTGSKIAQTLVLRGTPAELAAFEGQTLLDIKRRGKFLVFRFERDRIIINLMLTGRLGVVTAGDKAWPQWAAMFEFGPAVGGQASRPGKWPRADADWLPRRDLGVELRYRDATRMGKIYLMPAGVARPVAGWDEQGPDADDPALTIDVWRERIGRHSGELKSLLRNQAFVAGIGNAYSDEILWAARLGAVPQARVAGR